MLQFSNPAALWILALVIPVILLYLLKRKRQDRIVPSTLLWKQVLDDTQAYTPFQKLRSNLLLLLQILIIVLFTALMAQPYFASLAKHSRKWILVMDRSASMQATDEKPNRFEAARGKLRKTLNSIPPVDEVMLVAIGSEASILQNFTLGHDAIERKLLELNAEDVAADWDQLLLVLRPLLRDSPKPVLFIASDFANFSSQRMQSLPFDPLPVGRSVENVGITRAAIEPSTEKLEEQLLYFQIKNFSSQRKSVAAEVYENSELLDAFDFPLEPNGTAEKTTRITVVTTSQMKILLKPSDFFPLDNEFVLATKPTDKIPVHLEVQSPFLKHALEVLPAVKLSDKGGISIAESLQPEPGIYFLSGNNEKMSPIVQWNQTLDPMRFIDAGLWRISNYQILTIPAGAQRLIETPEGAAGYAEENGKKRQIVLGFKIEDSNLPLLAGFPIFIGNAVNWIEEGIHPKAQTRTSRTHTKEGTISSPDGYVNFADEKESDLNPVSIQNRSSSENRITMVRQDFSTWFLLALLCIVMLEWWAFHQKG